MVPVLTMVMSRSWTAGEMELSAETLPLQILVAAVVTAAVVW
jgi:hypothetical protein